MAKSDLPGNTRLWAGIVLASVFIIGAASGAALWHVFMGEKAPKPPPGRGPIPIHELDLTDAQQEKVDKILESYRPKLDAVLDEAFPKVRPIFDEIEKDIREVLTEAQKKKFDELKARRPPGAGRPGMSPRGKDMPSIHSSGIGDNRAPSKRSMPPHGFHMSPEPMPPGPRMHSDDPMHSGPRMPPGGRDFSTAPNMSGSDSPPEPGMNDAPPSEESAGPMPPNGPGSRKGPPSEGGTSPSSAPKTSSGSSAQKK